MVNNSNTTSNSGHTPDPLPAPEWGTMTDAAEILGVSRMTVTRYARDNRIRTRRKGPRFIEVDLTSLDNVYGPLVPAEASK